MKTTVTENAFMTAFDKTRPENFSYDGLRALFAYLEELEADTSAEIELDVIALCCDFAEYANLAEFQADYGDKYETLDDIRDATTVIEIDDDAFIIQQF